MKQFEKLAFFGICLILFAPHVLSYDQVHLGDIVSFQNPKSQATILKRDPSGQLWIFNKKSRSIEQINSEGGVVEAISPGQYFKKVSDFSFFKNGVMAISDSGYKRVVLLEPGEKQWTDPRLVKQISVPQPTAIAVSDDDVLGVYDAKGKSIRVYSADGVFLHRVYAPPKSEIKEVSNMVFGKDGVLWVLDKKSGHLHRFSPKRKWLGVTKGLEKPERLTRDDYGYVYVISTKGRWYEVGPEGTLEGQFGTKGKDRGQMSKPNGIAMEGRDILWVADTKNKRLQSFHLIQSKKTRKVIPEPLVRLQVRQKNIFNRLSQRALIHPEGKYLFLNSKKRQFEWLDHKGESLSVFGKKGKFDKGFKDPVDFDFDTKNQVWVLDAGDHKIKLISEGGQIVQMLGQKGRKEGYLKNPSILKFRKDGSMVVVDKKSTRVQVLSHDGLFLFTVGTKGKDKGQYSVVSGVAVNDDSIGIIDNERKAFLIFDNNGRFVSEISNKPNKNPIWLSVSDLTTDEKGRFYILDDVSRRVRIFNKTGRFMADLTVSGEQLATGPNGLLLVRRESLTSVYDVDFVPPKLSSLNVKDEKGIIKLAWDSCESCHKYQIYRSSSNAEFQQLDFHELDLISETNYFDERVLPGVAYIYAVRGISRTGYEGNWTQADSIVASRRTDISLVSVSGVNFSPIFSAAFKYYVDHPFGTVTIRNNDDRPYRNVKVSLGLKKYADFATEKKISKLKPGEERKIPVTLTFNDRILELTENTPVQVDVKLTYFNNNEEKHVNQNEPLTIYSRNSIVWNDKARISSFITPRDVPIRNFSKKAVKSFLKELKSSTVGKPMAKIALFYEALNAMNISYVQDPKTPYAEVSGNAEIIDYVQFPRETLKILSGDCDDTTALMASLLESIGVQVALVDTPGHIFLMANTEETDPGMMGYPIERFVEYQGTLWVPVETTKFGQDFFAAWQAGISQVELGRDQGKLEYIPIIEASEKYPPVTLVQKLDKPIVFPTEKVKVGFLPVLKKMQVEKYKNQLANIKNEIKKAPDNKMLPIRLGMIHVEGGKVIEGKKIFEEFKNDSNPEIQASAQNNLGNLAYLKGHYKKAGQHYMDASLISPDDGGIVINRARVAWKLGNKNKAKKLMYEARDLLSDWREYASDIPAELFPKY